MQDSANRTPKRILEESSSKKVRSKKSKKDPRVASLMKHLQLDTEDEDYVAKRIEASDYLQVLDHITAEFRKARGSSYPDFQQVKQDVDQMDILRDAIHPIAKYLRGGITIHDLYSMHALHPGRPFLHFKECDSVRLSLFWSYGALPVVIEEPSALPQSSLVVDPLSVKLESSLPPMIDNPRGTDKLSAYEVALAADQEKAFTGDYSHMRPWLTNDTSPEAAKWANVTEFVQRATALFVLYLHAFKQKHPGQTFYVGKRQDFLKDLLLNFHSKFVKEIPYIFMLFHADSALLTAQFGNAKLKDLKTRGMSCGYSDVRKACKTALEKWVKQMKKSRKSYPKVFQLMIPHFPHCKTHLAGLDQRILNFK